MTLLIIREIVDLHLLDPNIKQGHSFIERTQWLDARNTDASKRKGKEDI